MNEWGFFGARDLGRFPAWPHYRPQIRTVYLGGLSLSKLVVCGWGIAALILHEGPMGLVYLLRVPRPRDFSRDLYNESLV